MRDFSKTIMNGNAYKKLERKYEENGNKIMEIVEVGGNTLPNWVKRASSDDKNVIETALQGGLPNTTNNLYINGNLIMDKNNYNVKCFYVGKNKQRKQSRLA